MASHGVILTYESIRQWCLKFGQVFANEIRRRQPKRGDKWHLDEVYLRINGKLHYLWRAVDQEDHVLDLLVQSRRDRSESKRIERRRVFTKTRATGIRHQGRLSHQIIQDMVIDMNEKKLVTLDQLRGFLATT